MKGASYSMGSWNDWGANAPKTSNVPVLGFEDGKPLRIRLIEGPGKYGAPQKRFVHWPDSKYVNRVPFPCIGPRGGCIFHNAPFNWKPGCKGWMNVVAYYQNEDKTFDRRILAMPGGSTIYGAIKDQCDMIGVSVFDADYIVLRTGKGEKDTKYTITRIPGATIDGADGSFWKDFPAQESYADDAFPQLVDYDKLDGNKPMTVIEQKEALQALLTGEEQEAVGLDTAQAPPVQLNRPPAVTGHRETPPVVAPGSETVDAEVSEKVERPVPKVGTKAPPPKPPAPPKAAKTVIADPWNRPDKTLADCTPDELEFVVDATNAHYFTPEQIKGAEAIIAAGGPVAAAPAATADGEVNDEVKKAAVKAYVDSSPLLVDYKHTRAFYAIGGGSAVRNLSSEGLNKLYSLVKEGDEAVKEAIEANPAA